MICTESVHLGKNNITSCEMLTFVKMKLAVQYTTYI